MRLGRSLLAGLVNSGLAAVVVLAATPGYLHFLGLERYGVVGVFVALQGLLSLLDMGLSPTLNREVARATASRDWKPVQGLLASLTRLSWGMAAVLIVLFVAGAPWFAGHWLQRDSLAEEEVATSIAWMGVAIACRWPAVLYASAINGAHRLALSTSLASGYAVLSAGGALTLLALVEPSLTLFFAWQAFAAAVYSLSLRAAAWRVVGGAGARPAWGELRRIWRFSAGMGLIALTSVVFTQLDKVLLSRLLNLESFGLYALATLLAAGMYVVVTPVFNALYPRFSALVAGRQEQELWGLYRFGTSVMAIVVFPLATVLVVFAQPLVALWTQNAVIAAEVAPVFSLLCAGTSLHAMMYMPYALQLAYGKPRLAVGINLAMMVVLVPLTVSLTLAYGEVGSAAAWLALHCLYMVLGTTVTHRYLYPGRGVRWLARDVGMPLLLSVAVGVLARTVGPETPGRTLLMLIAAAGTWLAGVAVLLAVSPCLRSGSSWRAGAMWESPKGN